MRTLLRHLLWKCEKSSFVGQKRWKEWRKRKKVASECLHVAACMIFCQYKSRFQTVEKKISQTKTVLGNSEIWSFQCHEKKFYFMTIIHSKNEKKLWYFVKFTTLKQKIVIFGIKSQSQNFIFLSKTCNLWLILGGKTFSKFQVLKLWFKDEKLQLHTKIVKGHYYIEVTILYL